MCISIRGKDPLVDEYIAIFNRELEKLKAKRDSDEFKRQFAAEVKNWIQNYRERVKPFEKERAKDSAKETRNKKGQQVKCEESST